MLPNEFPHQSDFKSVPARLSGLSCIKTRLMKNMSSKYIFSIKIAVRVFIGIHDSLPNLAQSSRHDLHGLTTTLRLAGEPNTSLVYSAYRSPFLWGKRLETFLRLEPIQKREEWIDVLESRMKAPIVF